MSYPGTDAARVAAAVSGDRRALSELVDECLPVVLRWCARLGGSAVDAEDAAHDALMVVITRIHTLERAEAFPYWLFGITRNTLRRHHRRKRFARWIPGLAPEPVDEGSNPRRDAEMSETARRVEQVLDRLPTKQREVLVLVDLEERSTAEAAALLGVAQGTVKSRLRLGRARFIRSAEGLNLAPDLTRIPDPESAETPGAAS